MWCFNGSSCLNGSFCRSGFYSCSNQLSAIPIKDVSRIALVLPIAEALRYDLSPSGYVYLVVFTLLVTIGFISNLFSLSTFIREWIRLTVPGVYLIVFSVCSILLMTSIVVTILSAVYDDFYLSHVWTCHGYPYVSSVMFYTGMLMSAALAFENVSNQCLGCDKFRTRRYAILVVFLSFMFTSVIHLDKILFRRLQMNPSGDFYCTSQTTSHLFWYYLHTILLDALVLTLCFVHWTCFLRIFTMKVKEPYLRRVFLYRHYWIPALVITSCTLAYSIYRNCLQIHFRSASPATIRLHIGFLILLYAPQICTYWIYVVANDFHVREFSSKLVLSKAMLLPIQSQASCSAVRSDSSPVATSNVTRDRQ